jgi:D-hexose-6-phosphate mutarotase
MSSEDIKYVINMVLSSLDLTKLEPEDMEDVMSKFEDVEADEEMNMDMDSDMEEPTDVDMEMDVEMGEPAESAGHIFDELFKESKVDKVLSKYFEVSETEKNHLEKLQEERNEKKFKLVKESMNKVEKLSVSESQKLAGVKFIEENTDFNFIGRTNKNNLVFENKDKQVKVSPEGLVL